VRTCTLETASFDLVDDWLGAQRALWEGRTDRLERFVTSSAAGETDPNAPDRPESTIPTTDEENTA
jgi:hypothetical protein